MAFENIKKFDQHHFSSEKPKIDYCYSSKKFLLHQVFQLLIKPEIYVVCDKNDSYVSVFQLLLIPQLNYKFKRLTISPQRMTLLVNIMLRIVDKSFFTLINLMACP